MRNLNVVQRYCVTLRLHMIKRTKEEWAELKIKVTKLHSQGLSYAEISGIICVSRTTVRIWLDDEAAAKHKLTNIKWREANREENCRRERERQKNQAVKIRNYELRQLPEAIKRRIERDRIREKKRQQDPDWRYKRAIYTSRTQARKHNYASCNITFEELKDSFTGFCWICGLKETDYLRTHYQALSMDHDHVSGNFRGWLCQSCNKGLGHLGDNIKIIIERLLEYEKKGQQYV